MTIPELIEALSAIEAVEPGLHVYWAEKSPMGFQRSVLLGGVEVARVHQQPPIALLIQSEPRAASIATAEANEKFAKDHEGMELLHTSETRDASGELLLTSRTYTE